MTTREQVAAHVRAIETRALEGDVFSIQTLAAIVLLLNGFDEDGGDDLSIPEPYQIAMPQSEWLRMVRAA